MSSIELKKTTICSLHVDAIVNAANEGLKAGGGVCGAIFTAAGMLDLQRACERIGYCRTGKAVITPGFALPAKYIIHAVGPRWKDGKHQEAKLLYGAYYNSLVLATGNGCQSVAFPLISSGIFGYPVDLAWKEAFTACLDYFRKYPERQLHVIFAVISDAVLEAGRKALRQSPLAAYKRAEAGDWETQEMPPQRSSFILQRSFNGQQVMALRYGHIPEAMEDKWFWYMDGDTLYAYRSWTGYCIYRIDFHENGNHLVTVNCDPEQYQIGSLQEEFTRVNKLLDWWSAPQYDHYGEWLAETADMLNKAGTSSAETIIKFDHLQISGREVPAVYFHKPEEPSGFLCNWYPSPFDLEGGHFSSVEQYLMWKKCLTFGDEAMAEAVLQTNDPADQQSLARKASGYVDAVWAGMRQLVILPALYAKFSQNEELKKKLLATQDAYLVECAGYDRIWSCGVRLNDEKRMDAGHWKGQNILGFALMDVRRRLAAEQETKA